MFNFGLWVKLGIAGAALAAIVGAGWYVHHQIYQSGFDARAAIADKERVARATAAAKAIYERISENTALQAQYAEQHKLEEENRGKEIAGNLAIQQRNAGRRVPIDGRICGSGSAGQAQASGTGSAQQAAAGTWFLPDSFTRDLRQLAARADEVVADARAVQSAVKSSGCF